MEKFTYTNRKGESLNIEYGGNYILDGYDGLANTEIIPMTTKGYAQHGNTLNRTILGIRIISIYFYLFEDGMTNFYTKRRYLSSVFNPLLGEGVLEYTNNHTTKRINVLPTVLPTQVDKRGSLQLFNIELTAYDPFWYDNTETVSNMAGFESGLTLTNVGDYETPVRIEVVGAAVNPKITNSATGQFLKVNKVLSANQKIVFDTAYGNKTVTFTDAIGASSNAYKLLTNDSKFFNLQIGANKLVYGGTSSTPVIKMYWRNRFVGV